MSLETLLSNITGHSRVNDHPRIGAYELLETLGRGNFGKVKRARHMLTGHQYAIKIVDTDMLKQNLPGNLDIRREMSILRVLEHPNIVYLHEVMVSTTRVYMVMDLASGGDFFQFIRRRGRLPEPLARRFFRQLVDAVSYCHDNGVYHRDLKPENMLLTADGHLKVTDFGFSAMKDHGGAMLKTNCGSPHYCAPEVWNGTQKSYDGEKADSFSVGVILYVLLSGGQPFHDSDEERLLQKVDRCKVHYSECLSPDAVDLLQKLLVRDPKKRWDLRMVKRHAWVLAATLDDDDPLDALDSVSLTDGSDSSETVCADGIDVSSRCNRCSTCCARAKSLCVSDHCSNISMP